MDADVPSHPMAYAPLGAAVALLPFLGVPIDIAVSAGLTALLYAWLRRAAVVAHLSAMTLGALTVFGLLRLASWNINIVIPALAVLGIVCGIALRVRSRAAAWPGFRFFREDFLEFCALVGLVASFPAVMTFGVVGAADWVGRIAF